MVDSRVTGVFRAVVRDGYVVAEGGLLGELYDAFGARIGEVRAPFAGIVNYVIGTPPAVEGQPLAMVSRVRPRRRRRRASGPSNRCARRRFARFFPLRTGWYLDHAFARNALR